MHLRIGSCGDGGCQASVDLSCRGPPKINGLVIGLEDVQVSTRAIQKKKSSARF